MKLALLVSAVVGLAIGMTLHPISHVLAWVSP